MSIGQAPGVRIPAGQLASDDDDRNPPMNVRHVIPMGMLAVQWSDEAGMLHDEVWFTCGDEIHRPPNAETWAADLRTVKDALKQQVLAKLGDLQAQAAQQAEAPAEDSVDVLGNSDEPASSP